MTAEQVDREVADAQGRPYVVALSPDERRLAVQVLDAEYRLLTGMLTAVWSASLVRTTIFLGVLSAAGVALGFAAQGGVGGPTFTTLALAVLPLILFLGVATFVRIVQLQREAIVCITGINRIRYAFQALVPQAKPYYILRPFDDEQALYRGPGTGMALRPPRFGLLFLVVQTQGIVAIVTGAVAGALGWLASSPIMGPGPAWLLALLAFVVTVGALLYFWHGSLHELHDSIGTINPTPPGATDSPF
jgi:hypothetical protein